MEIKIRLYRKSDWQMVLSWWAASKEIPPLQDMMPEDSSFIAEINGAAVLAVTIYLTNTKEIAYVENFIGNPGWKGSERRIAARVLSDHLAEFACSLGYKRLLCMTEKNALKERYLELGFIPTLSGVTTFVRNI